MSPVLSIFHCKLWRVGVGSIGDIPNIAFINWSNISYEVVNLMVYL